MIPGPLKVPPAGVPVNVTGVAFTQIESGNPVKLTSGSAYTVTSCVVELVQPLPLV